VNKVTVYSNLTVKVIGGEADCIYP
jgi:hypothetical protein